MKKLILIIFTMLSIGTLAQKNNDFTTIKTYSSKKIKNIKIKNQMGDIVVIPSTDDTITIEIRSSFEYNLVEENSNDTVSINVENLKKSSFFSRSDDGVSIIVMVPKNNIEYLKLKQNIGNIKVSDITAPFNIKTNIGDITINNYGSSTSSAATINIGTLTLINVEGVSKKDNKSTFFHAKFKNKHLILSVEFGKIKC